MIVSITSDSWWCPLQLFPLSLCFVELLFLELQGVIKYLEFYRFCLINSIIYFILYDFKTVLLGLEWYYLNICLHK